MNLFGTKRPFYLFLFLILAAGFSLPSAHAEYYRWVDENGIVHYDQIPPDGRAVEKLGVAPWQEEDTTPETPSEATPADEATTTTEETPTEDTRTLAKSTKDPVECDKVRQNLANLETFARIEFTDPATGERRIMSDEERQKSFDEAKQWETYYCE